MISYDKEKLAFFCSYTQLYSLPMIADKNQFQARFNECYTLLVTPNSKRDATIISRIRALMEELFRAAPNAIPVNTFDAFKSRFKHFVAESKELENIRSKSEIALLDTFLLPVIPLRSSCLERVPIVQKNWSQAPARLESIQQKNIKLLSKEDCHHLALIRAFIFSQLQSLASMLETLDMHQAVYKNLLELTDQGVIVEPHKPGSQRKEGFQNVAEYSLEKLQIALRIGQLSSPHFAKVFVDSTVEELVNDLLDLDEQKKLDRNEVTQFLKVIEYILQKRNIERLYPAAIRLHTTVKMIFMGMIQKPIDSILAPHLPLKASMLFFEDIFLFWNEACTTIEAVAKRFEEAHTTESNRQYLAFLQQQFQTLIHPNRKALLKQIKAGKTGLLALYETVHTRIEEAISAKRISDLKTIASFRTIELYGTDEKGRHSVGVWKEIGPKVLEAIFQRIFDAEGKAAAANLVQKFSQERQNRKKQEPALPPIEALQIAEEKLAVVTDNEPKVLPIVYHRRVLRWRENNPKSDPFLTDPKYATKCFDPEEKIWIIAQHSFAAVIDQIALEEGIRIINQLSLIGEMTINGRSKKGIFTYTFNEDNVCYHRYFTIKTDNALVEETKRGFYDLDFPPLSDLAKEESDSSKVISADDQSFIVQKTKLIITICDPHNHGASIRLCRLKSRV